MPVREPCGSVQPPTTNSWRCVHFSLIQVGLRRDTYGESARLPIIPSRRIRHAFWSSSFGLESKSWLKRTRCCGGARSSAAASTARRSTSGTLRRSWPA